MRASLPFEQQCSPCRKRERNRLWREANPDAMAANAKRWREAGNKSERPEGYAEWHRDYAKQRYASDPAVKVATKTANDKRRREKRDEVNATMRQWHAANPEKKREYRSRHYDKIGIDAQRRQEKAARKTHRVARQADNARYNAARHGGDGIITNEHLVALHKWQDHCCFYCRNPLNQKDTIEHVVPLSRKGSNTPRNVVLACGDCNFSKQSKIFCTEWLPAAVADAPRYHSLFGTGQLKRLLAQHDIGYTDEGDHLDINGRPVFILSSFWLGWEGGDYIRRLKDMYPSSILFFDKEFVRRPQAIVNVLKAKAGIAERIGARKLMLAEPTPQEAREFIGAWHAMGATSGTHYLGLRDDNQWWIVAAFRRDIDRYDIVRMAIRETVAGGVSRIISHFRESMPEKDWPIVAFTDQRMGDGKSHLFANFVADGMTERSFFYATPEADGFHPRRDFQKQVLASKVDYFDTSRTQVALARANGLMRVDGLPRLRFILPPAT
jgi:HNH endonuclease